MHMHNENPPGAKYATISDGVIFSSDCNFATVSVRTVVDHAIDRAIGSLCREKSRRNGLVCAFLGMFAMDEVDRSGRETLSVRPILERGMTTNDEMISINLPPKRG